MRDEIEAFGRKWKRVWQEDDATRNFPNNEGHEYVDGAWKRLFGEPHQRAPMQDAEEDWGDATAVRIGDRLVVSSFDGDSIYAPADALTLAVPGTPCDCNGSPGTHEAGDACTAGECVPCDGTGCVTGGGQRVLAGAVEDCGACNGSGVAPAADLYTAMVREFHQRMGLVVRDAPSLGTPAEREERVRLMLKELLELARALGVTVLAAEAGELEMKDLGFYADGTADTASALHELADLQVTVSGTAVQFSLPLLAATREVHAANMLKMPQGPGRKPLKPAGWEPADVSKVLPGTCGGES